MAIGLAQMSSDKFQVTSQKHVIEGSSNLISESSSWYVTNLPSLVTIDIA